nr:SagB family peptide dehydrogenase [Kibdelosporangium sp. MJ126-NF4]
MIGLRPGVRSVVSDDGELFLVAWPYDGSLGRASDRKQAAVARLAAGPVSVDELGSVVGDDGELRELLERLLSGQWVYHTVLEGESPQYTVRPTGARRPRRTGTRPRAVTLSRFASLRREAHDMALSSPLSGSVVLVHEPELLAVMGILTRPSAPGSRSVVERLLDDLWREGYLVDSAATEDSEFRLAQWSEHELAFHAASRQPYGLARQGGFGATEWAAGRFDPLPARREPFSGEAIALPAPDMERLVREDISMTRALETRRSQREYDDEHPITLRQLGEFLHRCAHVRSVDATTGTSTRPSPSGGGLHELEIYPVTRLVSGLDNGIHHYDPFGHRLERVPATPAAARLLLEHATLAMGKRTTPQVLLIITARFGRTMAKYESMAYALTLKNVGALQQTMYLVATAMGLAPCAVEAGAPDVFAAATGIDHVVESPVGEFALGSC